MGKSLLDEHLYQYILGATLREPAILGRLREETSRHPRAVMQISPDQGQLMQLLVLATGARRTLELGVFTGYSSLAVALALPPDGQIIACDVSEEFTAVAKRYWNEAGVASKIDLRIAPAAETLTHLLRQGQAGQFDFAFIDADKTAYSEYFELCLQLLRRGGLIAVDNTLQRGDVLNSGSQDQDVLAIQRFNRDLRDDPRVLISLLPVADGLTLAVKK